MKKIDNIDNHLQPFPEKLRQVIIIKRFLVYKVPNLNIPVFPDVINNILQEFLLL